LAKCEKEDQKIASSDTFKLYYTNNTTEHVLVPFTTKDVVWAVETKKKFRNPKLENGQSLCDAFKVRTHKNLRSRFNSNNETFKGTVQPPNWQTAPCNLTDSGNNSGFENVDFIVWMNVAALPTFRKLYRRLDRTASPIFKDGLPPGQYELRITYSNYSKFQLPTNH
jgi:hypothetical protein